MKRQFKLLACLLVVIAMVFTLASCDLIDKILGKEPAHEHNFVEGKCDCGEVDPDYEAPHEHKYVDGKCECGAEDPDYTPHEHKYVDGKCECGAEDPDYVAPTPTPSTYTVYLLNQAGWEKVCVYYWAGADSNGWPGTELTVGEDGLYKVDIDTKYGELIFNNSNGGTGNQTADLAAPTDTNVVYDNVENKWITYEEALRILASTPTQNVINVTTTDTYSWVDEVTFTAAGEGNYTFTLPAGLGAWEKSACDAWPVVVGPYVDFNDNVDGATFTVGLEAEATLEFYVGAFNKADWQITWTYEECDVEAGGDQPGSDVPGDTLVLNVGQNTVVFADGELSQGKTYTFTVTEAGTYTFNGDLMAVVADAEGNTLGRGQVSLIAGTYNVTLFSMMPMPTNSFTINITVEVAGGEEEPDGSEENPYVWNTIPESVTFESDNNNKVYYVFTSDVNGSIKFTWAVEGNDWFEIFELGADGNTTQNNASGYEKTSHTFVIEAGKTYRVGLGTWNEGGETVVTISTTACDHEWSDATCQVLSTCSKCGATTGDYADHIPNSDNPTCGDPAECTVCGTQTSYIDHSWNDGVVNQQPDCSTETNGSMTLTCTVCGATQTEDIWYSHDWVIDENVEVTCTTDGYYKAHCSVCNKIDEETTEAEGHYNWYASCGETTECMGCGVQFTKEHAGSPATCTQAMYCYGCWEYIGEPLGHTEGDAATCTTAQICTVCKEELVAALGHKDENGDYKCDACSTKMLPEDGATLTIPQAIAIGKLFAHDTYTTQKYYITGIVTKISNTFYGNFYLVDAEGNEIYIYGLKDSTGAGNFQGLDPQPAVGDTLTVYTVLGSYSDAPQAKNAWFSELVQHTEHTWADATCKVAKTCTICGKTEGDPLDHTYVDGVCTGCGKAEPAQGTIITSTEKFAGLTQSGSYKTVTTTSGWTATNAAVLVGGASDANPVFKFIGTSDATKAITLNGKVGASGVLTSATLANGISKLSFNYGHAFSDSNGVDLTINILKDGAVVATTRLDNDAVTQKTAYEFTWELDVAVEGNIVIQIVNNSPSNNSSSNKDRVSIFNFTWDSAPVANA